MAACASEEKNINLSKIHLKTGTTQLTKGNADVAITSLEEAKKLNPNDPTIYNNLGLAYFLKKDFEKAEDQLKKALQLKPSYGDAKNNLGRVYIELARFDDAIKELTSVVSDPTYTATEKALVNLGLAYFKKGDLPQALTQFKKAISANSSFCPAHNHVGHVYFQMQKFEEATESFEAALKLCNNNYAEAHYYSALSYYKVGQREKALARLQEVVKLYSDTEFAPKARSMLKIIQ